ncbi:hypothetical protein FA95DRAFT_1605128, partial [Auriscalpium vulgare]
DHLETLALREPEADAPSKRAFSDVVNFLKDHLETLALRDVEERGLGDIAGVISILKDHPDIFSL